MRFDVAIVQQGIPFEGAFNIGFDNRSRSFRFDFNLIRDAFDTGERLYRTLSFVFLKPPFQFAFQGDPAVADRELDFPRGN